MINASLPRSSGLYSVAKTLIEYAFIVIHIVGSRPYKRARNT